MIKVFIVEEPTIEMSSKFSNNVFQTLNPFEGLDVEVNNVNLLSSSKPEESTDDVSEKTKSRVKSVRWAGFDDDESSDAFVQLDFKSDDIDGVAEKVFGNALARIKHLSHAKRQSDSFHVCDGKLMVRHKTSLGRHSILDKRGSIRSRDSIFVAKQQFAQKVSKMQSLYGDDDIEIDDETLNVTKAMVEDFNEISHSSVTCVARQVQLGALGLFLNIIQREVDFYSGNYECHIPFTFTPAKILVQFLRLCVSISTILMLYYMYKFHCSELKFNTLNRAFLQWENLWTNSRNFLPFLKDVLIYSVHEPPFLNICSMVSVKSVAIHEISIKNVFSLLMVLRVFLIIRLSYLKYKGGTRILGIWHSFDFSTGFTIRNFLYVAPFSSLLPVIISVIITSWYCLHICERQDEYSELQDSGDCIWALMITITGVGYGEKAPSSYCGRAILSTTATISQCLLAVTIYCLHGKLTLMPFENRMVEFLGNARSQKKLTKYAATVIQRTWKMYILRKYGYRKTVKRNAMNLATMMICSKSSAQATFTLQAISELTESIYQFNKHQNEVHTFDRRYRSDQLIRCMLTDIGKQCAEARNYYAMTNKLAAETGQALSMSSGSHNVHRRVDGSIRGFKEREYKIINHRQSNLRTVDTVFDKPRLCNKPSKKKPKKSKNKERSKEVRSILSRQSTMTQAISQLNHSLNSNVHMIDDLLHQKKIH